MNWLSQMLSLTSWGHTDLVVCLPHWTSNSQREGTILLIFVSAPGTVPETKYVLSIACWMNTRRWNSTFLTVPSPPFLLVNQVGINQRIRFIYWVLNQGFALTIPSARNAVPPDYHLAALFYFSAVSSHLTFAERDRSWVHVPIALCSTLVGQTVALKASSQV